MTMQPTCVTCQCLDGTLFHSRIDCTSSNLISAREIAPVSIKSSKTIWQLDLSKRDCIGWSTTSSARNMATKSRLHWSVGRTSCGSPLIGWVFNSPVDEARYKEGTRLSLTNCKFNSTLLKIYMVTSVCPFWQKPTLLNCYISPLVFSVFHQNDFWKPVWNLLQTAAYLYWAFQRL